MFLLWDATPGPHKTSRRRWQRRQLGQEALPVSALLRFHCNPQGRILLNVRLIQRLQMLVVCRRLLVVLVLQLLLMPMVWWYNHVQIVWRYVVHHLSPLHLFSHLHGAGHGVRLISGALWGAKRIYRLSRPGGRGNWGHEVPRAPMGDHFESRLRVQVQLEQWGGGGGSGLQRLVRRKAPGRRGWRKSALIVG